MPVCFIRNISVTPFQLGLGIDFGDWAGDRLIKKSTMVAMTLSPGVAWKLSDKVSVGASAELNYGFLSLTRKAEFARVTTGKGSNGYNVVTDGAKSDLD